MREQGFLGWATGPLVKLDDAAPGVLARVLTAAPARRQAIFSALAHWRPEIENAPFFDLAEVVRHGRPADILRHVLEVVPAGYAGLLERISVSLPDVGFGEGLEWTGKGSSAALRNIC